MKGEKRGERKGWNDGGKRKKEGSTGGREIGQVEACEEQGE
jgi:hypothetical protein